MPGWASFRRIRSALYDAKSAQAERERAPSWNPISATLMLAANCSLLNHQIILMPPLFNRSLQAPLVGNIMNLYHRAITSTPAASAERERGAKSKQKSWSRFLSLQSDVVPASSKNCQAGLGWGAMDCHVPTIHIHIHMGGVQCTMVPLSTRMLL